MSIKKSRLIIPIIAMIGIMVSVLFLYLQKNSGGMATENLASNDKEVVLDKNIIPMWVSYTHPSLGYTLEYPKNILPQMRPGDTLFDIYFYKNTPAENPIIFISLRNSRTLSLSERNKLFPSEITKKTIISGVDAYIITDNKYPNSLSVELDKGGVFYSIGFRGLSPAIIDHIINSFHIDFVPKNL